MDPSVLHARVTCQNLLHPPCPLPPCSCQPPAPLWNWGPLQGVPALIHKAPPLLLSYVSW